MYSAGYHKVEFWDTFTENITSYIENKNEIIKGGDENE